MTQNRIGSSLGALFGKIPALWRRALPPPGGKRPRGMRQRAVRLAARRILEKAQRQP